MGSDARAFTVRQTAADDEAREFEISEDGRPVLEFTVGRDPDDVDGKMPWACSITRLATGVRVTGGGRAPIDAFEDAYGEWDTVGEPSMAWKDIECALADAGAFRID